MSVFVVSATSAVAQLLGEDVSPAGPPSRAAAAEVVDLRATAELLERLAADEAGGRPVGLVLLDVPIAEGLAACRRIRERPSFDAVPVIVVTDREDATSVDAAYEAGASDYLPRPFGPTELRGRVRSELALAVETTARRAREQQLLAVTARLEEANRELRAREEELARQLERGLAFQNALLDLATLEKPTFEQTLRRALELISRAMGVARVGYWELLRADGRARAIRCHTLYLAAEARFEGGITLEAEAFPRYFAALEEGAAVSAEDACDDPRTSEFRDVYLRPLGIGAMLDIPVFVGGVLAGVICHEHVGPPRRWRLEERQFAFSVGQILSLVIETESRRRAEESLRESRAQLATVIETALDAVITMTEDGRILGWNRQAELLFGKRREDVLGHELAEVALPAIREYLGRGHGQGEHGVRLEIVAKDLGGADFPVEISVASFALSGSKHFSAFVRDITQRKRYEEALRHSATHDALTGLANRARFVEAVDEVVRGRRATDRVALVFLDLDHFKQVNDTRGHHAGDELLRGIAHRIRGCLRAGDLPARMGGDEFTVLLERVSSDDEALAIGERLLEAIRAPFDLAGLPYVPSASVGVVVLSGSGRHASADEALRDADAAMYAAKTAGKGRVALHRL